MVTGLTISSKIKKVFETLSSKIKEKCSSSRGAKLPDLRYFFLRSRLILDLKFFSKKIALDTIKK